MKELFRKMMAMVLVLALVFALAACAGKTAGGQEEPTPSAGVQEEPTPSAGNQGESTPTPTPGTAPTTTPTTGPSQILDVDVSDVDFLPDNEVDVAQQILGFPGSTTLFTVDGVAVTAEEYLYWLGYMTSYYEMMFTYYGYLDGYTEMDFDEVIGEDGATLDQELKESAFQNSVILAVVPELVKEYGVSLSGDDMAELIQLRASSMENAGGRDYYAYELQAMGINDTTTFKMDMTSALFTNLQEVYIAGRTAQDVADFAEAEGFLGAKHILLLTTDMTTGVSYDAATIAQQKAKAEDILAQLRSDPSKFDSLMNQYSEDTGLPTNPDGYFFGPGKMVASFENGTKALEIGEISDVIESEYGYHIIQRLDPDSEEIREQMFDAMIEERVNAAAVEKTPEYDSFTAREYYEALLDFQAGMDIPVYEEDVSNATLEPQPTGN